MSSSLAGSALPPTPISCLAPPYLLLPQEAALAGGRGLCQPLLRRAPAAQRGRGGGEAAGRPPVVQVGGKGGQLVACQPAWRPALDRLWCGNFLLLLRVAGSARGGGTAESGQAYMQKMLWNFLLLLGAAVADAVYVVLRSS